MYITFFVDIFKSFVCSLKLFFYKINIFANFCLLLARIGRSFLIFIPLNIAKIEKWQRTFLFILFFPICSQAVIRELPDTLYIYIQRTFFVKKATPPAHFFFFKINDSAWSQNFCQTFNFLMPFGLFKMFKMAVQDCVHNEKGDAKFL